MSLVCVPAPAAAVESCKDDTEGWCVARRIAGSAPTGELGFRFGEPLDANGDGKADVAAGARFKLQKGTLQNGSVTVFSGADGKRIRSWDGELADALFGHSVVPVPDLDSDHLADVFISAPVARFDDVMRGVVVALSPKSGAQMWSRSGDRDENLGWDMALAGDHDGDGLSDLFVGAPGSPTGKAYLLTSKDGSTLRKYMPKEDEPTFGWYVARVDDLDGDKMDDVVVGAQLERSHTGEMVGGAHVFSAASGKELFQWKGFDSMSGFGEVVAAISDLDGDGKGEVVVSAPRTNDDAHDRPGDVYVFSGANGEGIRHFTGAQPGEIYGRMIYSAGDVDGDTVDDLAIGAPWYRVDLAERVGRLEIRSGKSGEVLANLVGDEGESWFGWHVRRAPDPDGLGRPTLLVSSLRRTVDGKPHVGVLDVLVLARAELPAEEQPKAAESAEATPATAGAPAEKEVLTSGREREARRPRGQP